MKKLVLIGCLLVSFLFVLWIPKDARVATLPVDSGSQVRQTAIYPNPVKDHFFVRLEAIHPERADNSDLTFEIRNILGNIMPVQLEEAEQDIYRIDTQSYPAGYYLLIVRCASCHDESPKAFKFLKQ